MRFARNGAAPGRSPRLRVAVIGCGYWGRNYVRVFNELPDAEVVTICDADRNRLDALAGMFPGVAMATRLEDIVALPLDAAVICTPAATHHEVARTCLQHGLHVLVEKPLTTRSEDADDLIAIAESAGRTLMVGHTFLFNAAIRTMREHVAREEFGRIYYLYARRTSLGPIRADVGAVWDLAPHDLSIFQALVGAPPTRLRAVGTCLLSDGREDVGFVTLTYPGDIAGLIHVSWADPNKTREVVVVGSRQRIVFDDMVPVERVRVFHKGVTRVPEPETYGEFFQVRDGDIVSPVVEASEPLKTQCAHFVDCVRTDSRPLTDGWAGRDVVRTLEAIDESMRLDGAPVDVQPEPPDDTTDEVFGVAATR